MTIIDESGGPLPDGHPLKRLQNIPGAKRPAAPSEGAPRQPAPGADSQLAPSRESESKA